MKEYIRPEPIKLRDIENPIGLGWVDYFLNRGISINTLMKLKVITTTYKFPQNEFAESEAVVFPYYKDERLLFYKYRGLKKEFAMSKAPELIFWNIDSMIATRSNTVKDVIICEGEIDVLSWVEAGFERVISVPNGANLKASATTYPYIDNTITCFDNIETIYISTDSDEAGKKLKEDLCRRMGRDRCKIIELPEGCKDANDVLKLEKGKEKLVRAFENADWYPMDGVFTLSGDVEEEYDALMRGDVPSYKSLGWKPIDELVKFNNGDALTLISGARFCKISICFRDSS
jgi:twinkle protein